MPKETSAGAIIFRKEDSQICYLLLRYESGHWGFPKGHIESGENKMATVKREVEEEIGVELKEIEKVATLNFRFPYKREWEQDVYVFLARDWEGEPIESEEMRPRWFRIEDIPFEEMWDDDKFWLPEVLAGKKLRADFVFKRGGLIDRQNIKFVKGFE